MEGRPRRATWWLVAWAVLLLIIGVAAVVRHQPSTFSPRSASQATSGRSSGLSPGGEPAPTAGAASRSPAAVPARSGCPSAGVRPFEPASVRIPGVHHPIPGMAPPREDGVPGTPPLTQAGKHLIAYDRAQGIVPGDPRGNVLLNTHTWPDGTALGNHLLAALHVGDRLVVRGHRAGARLCYRVTKRVEVLAAHGYDAYYATDGPPQLAIIVCSGIRIAPGRWTHRTIWFARLTA
jgi:hypothetical protein